MILAKKTRSSSGGQIGNDRECRRKPALGRFYATRRLSGFLYWLGFSVEWSLDTTASTTMPTSTQAQGSSPPPPNLLLTRRNYHTSTAILPTLSPPPPPDIITKILKDISEDHLQLGRRHLNVRHRRVPFRTKHEPARHTRR